MVVADVSVRPAHEQDATQIGRVQVAAWQTAYTAILPPSIREALSPEIAARSWLTAITAPPSSRHRVLVAQDGDWLVGFVAISPDEDVPATQQTQQTAVIGPLLVEPRWGRRGHGSRLLAAATDTARLNGATRAVAWLPEADEVSRKFFAEAGWAADGAARVLDAGDRTLREIRIHTSLAG